MILKTYRDFMRQSVNNRRYVVQTHFGSHSVKDAKKKEVKEEIHGPTDHDPDDVDNHDSDLQWEYKHYTDDDKDAIYNYTTSSLEMNDALHSRHTGRTLGGNRYEEEDYAEHKDNIEKMDDAVNRHKTSEEMHVYTGVPHSPLKYRPNTGDNNVPLRAHLPSFTSTSIDVSHAQKFAKQSELHKNDQWKDHHHMLKIAVPAGHAGAYTEGHGAHKGEREFVLPRDTKLNIHHVPEHREDGGKKYAIWHATIE